VPEALPSFIEGKTMMKNKIWRRGGGKALISVTMAFVFALAAFALLSPATDEHGSSNAGDDATLGADISVGTEAELLKALNDKTSSYYAEDGDTIKLTAKITFSDPFILNNRGTIYIDLGDNDLSLKYAGGGPMQIENSKLIQTGTGTGKFVITPGDGFTSVYVAGRGEVKINADISGGGYGISANEDSTVTVTGEIKSQYGVYAYSSSVTVNGDMEGQHGVYAGADSTVIINGKLVAGVAVNAYGSKVTVNGDIISKEGIICVDANGGSTVTVNGNITTIYHTSGVDASGGSTVTVNGSINAEGPGVNVSGDGATVTVGGNITADGDVCVHAYGKSITVTVGGDITSDEDGVRAEGGANITIGGNITSVYRGGVEAKEGSTVTVYGSMKVEGGGVEAHGGSTVTVYGNIDDIGSGSGVYASGSTVTVYGSIKVKNSNAVSSSDSSVVTVYGNITSVGIHNSGVYASGPSKATINGNITSDHTGVWAEIGAEVTINGLIKGPTAGSLPVIYIKTDTKTFTKTENNSTKDNYLGYKEDLTPPAASVVWVFDESKKVLPTMTGPESMSLTEGYAAISTDAYTVGPGLPEAYLTQDDTHGGKIVWNNDTKKLDIATGLAANEYKVALTAENAFGSVSVTFTLTITGTVAPDEPGDSTMLYVAIAIIAIVAIGFVVYWFFLKDMLKPNK
jgi:hypothetical protein